MVDPDPSADAAVTRVVACIPSIGRSPHLYDLVQVLLDDDVAVRVYVNDETATFNESLPDVVHMPGHSIYAEWNEAAIWAREENAHLLLLNDDIVMMPGTVRVLADTLDRYDSYGLISVSEQRLVLDPGEVLPTSHQRGNRYSFLPWCALARAKAWQNVDPRYQIWYGDDDLIWKMVQAGWDVGILSGVGAVHHVSTTSQQLPWVSAATHADAQLWRLSGH